MTDPEKPAPGEVVLPEIGENLTRNEIMDVLGSVDNHLDAMSAATRFQHAA